MKRNSGDTLRQEGRAIINAIEEIKEELATARQNFDLATDDALIDCYIYEISALTSKYQYFLKKAKGCGLIAEGFDEVTA